MGAQVLVLGDSGAQEIRVTPARDCRASMGLMRWLGRQEWIRFGIRKRIIGRWCARHDLDVDFEVDFFGFVYRGNLRDYIDRCVFLYGAYEKANLALLRDQAAQRSKPVFVDIGANVGQHTLWMSRYCPEVYAFEPWEPVRRRLEDKVRSNGLDHVTVFAAALGEHDEDLPFYSPPGSDTGIGSFLPSHHAWNRDLGEVLPVRGGDAFFAEQGIHPDLIKLDVEGFEQKVLAGLRKTLKKYRPAILMEFSPTTRGQFGTPERLTEAFPYPVTIQRVVALEGWRYRLVPFVFDQCGDVLIMPA